MQNFLMKTGMSGKKSLKKTDGLSFLPRLSIGGDSDTIACIAGGIAEAYYKSIPDYIMSEGKRFIDSG